MIVCPTVSELRFYGCYHPCLVKSYLRKLFTNTPMLIASTFKERILPDILKMLYTCKVSNSSYTHYTFIWQTWPTYFVEMPHFFYCISFYLKLIYYVCKALNVFDIEKVKCMFAKLMKKHRYIYRQGVR